MATRNITLQTKRLNKKWDLSPEKSGRATPNIKADTHFSPSCIASLASQLWLLTKNRAALLLHADFVDTLRIITFSLVYFQWRSSTRARGARKRSPIPKKMWLSAHSRNFGHQVTVRPPVLTNALHWLTVCRSYILHFRFTFVPCKLK